MSFYPVLSPGVGTRTSTPLVNTPYVGAGTLRSPVGRGSRGSDISVRSGSHQQEEESEDLYIGTSALNVRNLARNLPGRVPTTPERGYASHVTS